MTDTTPRHMTKTAVLTLRGGRVTSDLRDAIFDAANRRGETVNEFVLKTVARDLRASGRNIRGVFFPGDCGEAC